jgi:uncharacterized membrane protein YedE/YeeE
MSNFTPLASTMGGALLGLSASSLLVFNGRVAGVAGILRGALQPQKGDVAWRVLFLAGLLTGSGAFALLRPESFGTSPRPLALVIAAGLFVGLGVRISNGCTTGHGICGLSRFSKRSLVATMTFMTAAAATTFICQHAIGGLS